MVCAPTLPSFCIQSLHLSSAGREGARVPHHSSFLFLRGARGLWEVRASPLQLGPATPEWEGLGEAGPGEAGWLCCLCQL